MLKERLKGRRIGYVPTMGALHEGHLSLIRAAKKESDIVCASIFVNPLQFGPREDFRSYPRPLAKDLRALSGEKTDFLFHPEAADMYSDDFLAAVSLGNASAESSLTKVMCGAFRPGHFTGVATIVAKLFNIVQPHTAYFGAKDYQQTVVIKKMVRDLNFPARIRVVSTFREKDGLALSSRNQYLGPEERERASHLSRVLFSVKKQILDGEKNLASIKASAVRDLSRYVDRVQYFDFRDPETLSELVKPGRATLAAAACYVGKTRLIDNVIITAAGGARRTKS